MCGLSDTGSVGGISGSAEGETNGTIKVEIDALEKRAHIHVHYDMGKKYNSKTKVQRCKSLCYINVKRETWKQGIISRGLFSEAATKVSTAKVSTAKTTVEQITQQQTANKTTNQWKTDTPQTTATASLVAEATTTVGSTPESTRVVPILGVVEPVLSVVFLLGDIPLPLGFPKGTGLSKSVRIKP